MSMGMKYDLTTAGMNMLIKDAFATYDPRDVLLAAALAGLTVYIIRYTDAIEAAVDTSADLMKTLAEGGVSGSGGDVAGLTALLAMVPK